MVLRTVQTARVLFTFKTGMLVICKQNPYLIAAKSCLQIKVTGMWFYPQNKAFLPEERSTLEGTCFHIPSSKKCLQYQGILQLYPKEATLNSGFFSFFNCCCKENFQIIHSCFSIPHAKPAYCADESQCKAKYKNISVQYIPEFLEHKIKTSSLKYTILQIFWLIFPSVFFISLF